MPTWAGNILVDSKNYIYAAIVQAGKEYKAIVYRDHMLWSFDGFQTHEKARSFAEKAIR